MKHIKQFIFLTAVIFIALFLLCGDAYAWYDSNYSYRRELTIEQGYASGVATTTDAPFVIVASTTQDFLKDDGQANGKIAEGMGYDIIFVDDDDTTLLDFEYEYYASSTGALVAWIEMPDISSTTDRTFYMYYGYSSATDNSTSGATWSPLAKGVPHQTVSVWHLDENPAGSAPQMSDSTNNDNDGTSGGSMTYSDQVPGQLDGSLDFDGSDDYVNVGSGSSLDDVNTFTYSAWISLDDSETDIAHIIDKSLGSTARKSLYLYGASNYIYGFVDTDDTNAVSQSANSSFIDETWTHVVITYDDNGDRKIRIYKDGSEVSYTTQTAGTGTVVSDASYTMEFGATAGTHFYLADMTIDDVRIYNIALTPEDIKTMYNMENDNSSFLTFGAQEDSSDSADFTVSAWVRPVNSMASKAIVAKQDELRLITDADGKVGCQVHSTSTWETAVTSTDALSLNQWNYVSCTYDRSNIKVYTNGVLQGTQASDADIFNATTSLMIGFDEDENYGDFQGYIDEFKYYKYARSAGQIKADYAGTATERGASTRSVTVGEQRDASQGLVAHWKMDESYWDPGSATVLDASGNANHGTPQADATSTAAAKYGRAGTFDGTGDYVDLGQDIFNSLDVATIVVWVKWNALSVSNWPRIFESSINSSNWVQFGLNNSDYIHITTRDSGSTDGISSNATMQTDQWYHIAVVLGSSGKKLYIDSVLQTDTSADTTCFNDLGSTQNVYLSYSYDSTPMDGIIDDVKIYNVARSAEQIRRDYETGPPPIAHWTFDEKTGDTAYDTSENSNDGTLGSGAGADSADPTWTQGKYGSGLEFDGVDDYIEIPDFDYQ